METLENKIRYNGVNNRVLNQSKKIRFFTKPVFMMCMLLLSFLSSCLVVEPRHPRHPDVIIEERGPRHGWHHRH